MSGGEYVPTTEEVMSGYIREDAVRAETSRRLRKQFKRWLTDHDARIASEAAEKALREVAEYLDGGTPRAWGFHHPCDPPGTRWEPSPVEESIMRNADLLREQADRLAAEREDRS